VIAGPDQVGWREELICRAAQLGVASRITWAGMIGGSIKWGALRAAEAFVLPSHQENFGVAVVEALAASVPALISNKVNIWRDIEADGAGIVRQDTLEGTCELLRAYIEMPESRTTAMHIAARDCFERRFNIKVAAESLHKALVRATGVN